MMPCTNGGGAIPKSQSTDPLDSPTLNRRKFFEYFRKLFLNDFEFIDIRDDLNQLLLTEDECRLILHEPTLNKQLERLFFLLTYNEKKSIRAFVDGIRQVYPWLSTAMDKYHDRSSEDLDPFEKCINCSWLPNKRNVRVYRCELLWDVIQYLQTLPRQHYLIIRGRVGFGKSWLATDACMDYNVIRSMNFQIFWLNMTDCLTPEGILKEMHTLEIYMRDTPYQPLHDRVDLRIIELRNHFKKSFSSDKYQNALLVLCDVQSKEVLKAFDFHCKILVTGRNESCFDEISSHRKRSVVIDDGLTEQESLDFFEKLGVFSGSKYASWYRRKLSEIHRFCRGEPIVMSLISTNILQYKDGRDRKERLTKYIQQLRANSLTTTNQLESTIEESLIVLPDNDRQLYQRMVVFPTNVYVPISVLARYWKKTEEDARELVIRLYRFSFLTIDTRKTSSQEESTDYVSMHYIYSSYLRKLYREKDLLQMHLDICHSYEIEIVLSRRTEPELFDLPDDGYMHYYIGYHLQKSHQTHLFKELYFDFGFLEQKLRYTGLTNTHGDLEAYRTEIVEGDKDGEAEKEDRVVRGELLDELSLFLPTIEEMVHGNKDTSLLQYALNATSDVIVKEARRQVQRYGSRVWFDDVGHPVKQRRQMVELQRRPVALKCYGPEAVIAAMDNHSIVLKDLSTTYVVEATLLKEHTRPVVKIDTFGSHFLISLDEGGTLLVWSLKDTPIHLAKCADGSTSTKSLDGSPRRSGSEDHLLKMGHFDNRNVNYRKPVCRLEAIKSFTIHEQKNGNSNGNGIANGHSQQIRLFCGTVTGPIRSYEWCQLQELFQKTPYFELKTDQEAKVLKFLPPHILMVLTVDRLSFYNIRDTSQFYLTKQWVQVPHPLAIYEAAPSAAERSIYCVFQQRIVCIRISSIHGAVLGIESIEDVFRVKTSGLVILCSSQSDDGKYLVLGTTRGIVVFDCATNSELQRNSIGYRISCIDICTLDDLNYRYLMVSGTESEVVNIYGLPGRKSVSLARTMSTGDRSVSNGSSVKPIGEGFFEVIRKAEEDVKNEDELSIIYAVDTKHNIRMLASADGGVKSYGTKELKSWMRITCTGQWRGLFCYGTVDGKFFVCHEEVSGSGSSGQPTACLGFPNAIVYIKGVDAMYCVVGTETEYKILSACGHVDKSIQQTGKIIDCFPLNEVGRILIVRDSGPVQLVNMDGRSLEARVQYSAETEGKVRTVGCEFQAETLALLDVNGKVRFFAVERAGPPDEFKLTPTKELFQNMVSTIALSKDAAILAVGSMNGDIYIYRMSDMEKIQILSSHKRPIKHLEFSPWCGLESNAIVLVSLSEQMCFWNIKYVINNPLDGLKKKPHRRSSRFSKELKNHLNGNGDGHSNDSSNKDNNNGLKTNGNGVNGGKTIVPKGRMVNHGQFWEDKMGASDKPELLACIKFVGNSATKLVTNEDFTKFITIDNEGDIYALAARPASVPEDVPSSEWTIDGAALIKRVGDISLANTLSVPS